MHVVSWFVCIGILIGGLLRENNIAILGACIGVSICCICDGLYFVGKKMMEMKGRTNEDESD